MDFGNVLVISQPALGSCVHIIDGRHPFYSASDPGNVILVGNVSNIDNVLTGVEPSVPQEFAFGPEPLHSWCFYYEKAELASQAGKWDQVVSLGDEASRRGFHPVDQSEWMPFLPFITTRLLISGTISPASLKFDLIILNHSVSISLSKGVL